MILTRPLAAICLILTSILLYAFPVAADNIAIYNFDDGEIAAVYPSHTVAPVYVACANSSYLSFNDFSYHYGDNQFKVSLTCHLANGTLHTNEASLNGKCQDNFVAVGLMSSETSNINSSDDLSFLVEQNILRLLCRSIPTGYSVTYYTVSSNPSSTMCGTDAVHSITQANTICAKVAAYNGIGSPIMTVIQSISTTTVTATSPASTITSTVITTVLSSTQATVTETVTITSTASATTITSTASATTITSTASATTITSTAPATTITLMAPATVVPFAGPGNVIGNSNVFANNTITTTVTVTAAQAAVSTMTATVTTTIGQSFASTVTVTNTATTTVTSISTTIVTSTTTMAATASSLTTVPENANAASGGQPLSTWKSAIVELVAISTSLLFII